MGGLDDYDEISERPPRHSNRPMPGRPRGCAGAVGLTVRGPARVRVARAARHAARQPHTRGAPGAPCTRGVADRDVQLTKDGPLSLSAV
jgi:hypothetical protein